MARFRFPFERLLRLRGAEKRLQMFALARSLRGLSEAERIKTQSEVRRDELVSTYSDLRTTAADVPAWTTAERAVDRAGRDVVQCSAAVEQAMQRVDVERQRLRTRTQDAEMLRRLRQRHWEIHRTAEQRAEQKEIDSVAADRRVSPP